MITSVGLGIAKSLATGILKDKITSIFKDKRSEFEQELTSIIDTTIERFDSYNPIKDSADKIPFYKSQLVVEELLKFRLSSDFDKDYIIDKIDNSTNILQTSPAELSLFFKIFDEEVSNSEHLIKFEVKDLYPKKIFEISEQLSELSDNLKTFIKQLNIPLNAEYYSSLDEIEQKIFSFNPKSALERIEALEKRIKSTSNDDNVIGRLT